jgi:hypothetical protein
VVSVDPHQVRAAAPLRHPPFPAEVRRQLERLRDGLAAVHPLTLEQWEDDFRRDANPAREIAVWLHVLECYEHFCGGRGLSPQEKLDTLTVLVVAMGTDLAVVEHVVSPATLSRARVREIAAHAQATWTAKAP